MSNLMVAGPYPQDDCPYWVGDVLVTMSEISPQQRWPWTSWVQITDCMLRAADGTHPAGSTGGAWEVTQTVEQIARHVHEMAGSPATGSEGKYFSEWSGIAASTTGSSGGRYYPVSIGAAGDSKPMPIANKYTAVYMYRRTA